MVGGFVGRGYRDFLLERFPTDTVGVVVGLEQPDFAVRILRIVQPRLLYILGPWHRRGIKETLRVLDERLQEYGTKVLVGCGTPHAFHPPEGVLDWVYLYPPQGDEQVVLDYLKHLWPAVRPFGFMSGEGYDDPKGLYGDSVTLAVQRFRRETHDAVLIVAERHQWAFVKGKV